ncbi:MAG TPA: hypothetical protein VF008_16035 [Niastella sp.]
MMRNVFFTTLLLTLSVVFLTGCKKEKISPTQGELTANELKSVIEKNGIKRVYTVNYNAVFPNSFPVDAGHVWSFSNGFIYVNYNTFIQNYNLNYLVGYSIHNVILSDGKTDKALILYME